MAGVPSKRGEIFNWETELTSQADTSIFQVNPTIAAGDVIVYKDGVLDGNIDTTPTPIGASATVACVLSAAEMTAGRVKVRFHDAVGAEWQDQSWEFFTVTTPFDELIAAIVTAILASALVANVWSYATRTLTSFGTLVATVWAYATRTLTQSAAEVAAAVSGSALTILRGDTWSASITGLGDISNYSALWFTVKRDRSDADSASILQVLLTSPAAATDGLQYLNAAAATASQGSIVVDDATAGNVTIAIDEAATAQLAGQACVYDIQVRRTTGAVNTLSEGECDINADVTRATS